MTPTTKSIPQLVRAKFSRLQSFTARDVTKAVRAHGLLPTRGVVATALWRMALQGELSIQNAPVGAYWTGGRQRRYSFR